MQKEVSTDAIHLQDYFGQLAGREQVVDKREIRNDFHARVVVEHVHLRLRGVKAGVEMIEDQVCIVYQQAGIQRVCSPFCAHLRHGEKAAVALVAP